MAWLKSFWNILSYKNFAGKSLYDNIFQKFLSQAMAFMLGLSAESEAPTGNLWIDTKEWVLSKY